MYLEHFGLKKRPFAITPDPSLVIWTDQHVAVLDALLHQILSHAPLTVLTGDIGCGKTTILKALLAHPMIVEKCRTVLISVRVGSTEELLHHLARASGKVDDSASLTDAQARSAFDEWLGQSTAAGRIPLVILDEAQTIATDAALFLARLLAGGETRAAPPSVLLVGQPELASVVNRPALRTLKLRVGQRLRLGRLPREQVAAFVQGRLRAAGFAGEALFDSGAAAVIHEFSRGAPRLINKLCDLCLHAAAQQDRQRIDADFVRDVIAQFQLVGGSASDATRDFGSGRDLMDAFVDSMAASRATQDDGIARDPESVSSEAHAAPAPSVSEEQAAEPLEPAPRPRIRKRATALGAVAALVLAAPLLLLLPKPGEERSPVAVSDQSYARAPDAPAPAPEASPAPSVAPAVPSVASDAMASLADPAKLAPGDGSRTIPETAVPVLMQSESPGDETAPVPAPSAAPVAALAPLAATDAQGDAETFFRGALDSADPVEIVVGFARAALRGHSRSADYLGQLFETGDGVVFAPEMAERWYAVSRDPALVADFRPAAAEPIPAPQSAATVRAIVAGEIAELVWQGRAAIFTVELAGPDGRIVAEAATALTAIRLPLPEAAVQWRVRTDGGAASDWRGLDPASR